MTGAGGGEGTCGADGRTGGLGDGGEPTPRRDETSAVDTAPLARVADPCDVVVYVMRSPISYGTVSYGTQHTPHLHSGLSGKGVVAVTSQPAVCQRRRGRALEAAIFAAALAELADVGYARLSMEGIAARARTAKSSLYRRWSSLEEIVVAAVESGFPDPDELPQTGELRTDLLEVLGQIANIMDDPSGRAMTSILGAVNQSPKLQATIREKILAPRLRRTQAIFDQAAQRGEIRPESATRFIVHAGPAIVTHAYLIQGRHLTVEDIENIIDQVIIPAVLR